MRAKELCFFLRSRSVRMILLKQVCFLL